MYQNERIDTKDNSTDIEQVSNSTADNLFNTRRDKSGSPVKDNLFNRRDKSGSPVKRKNNSDSTSDVIFSIINWRENVYSAFLAKDPKISSQAYKKWLKILTEYYISFLLQSNLELAYRILVLKTGKCFNCSNDIVQSTFELCTKSPVISSFVSHKEIMSMFDSYYTDELIKEAGIKEYELLIMRYFPMKMTEGFFLSVWRDIYFWLYNSSPIPVIEAYGSPFNHVLPEYCSLFSEDEKFGAFCRFEVYIKRINFPCRLLLNPPYVMSSIKECCISVIDYMKRTRGEFIAILPVMYHIDKLDELMELPNTYHKILPKGTFPFYCFFNRQEVITNSDLCLIVNVSGNLKKSEQMCENIAFHARNKASTIC